MKFDFSLRNRGLSFYLTFASAIVAIVSSIVLFVIDRVMVIKSVSFDDKTLFAFLFMVLGGLIGLVSCFVKGRFVPLLAIVSVLLYGCGVGQHLVDCCYPYADLGTSVPFFTNSGVFAKELSVIFTVFLVLFVFSMVASLVSCFMKEKKED